MRLVAQSSRRAPNPSLKRSDRPSRADAPYDPLRFAYYAYQLHDQDALPLPALKELVERFKYPGLRLKHLYAPATCR